MYLSVTISRPHGTTALVVTAAVSMSIVNSIMHGNTKQFLDSITQLQGSGLIVEAYLALDIQSEYAFPH